MKKLLRLVYVIVANIVVFPINLYMLIRIGLYSDSIKEFKDDVIYIAKDAYSEYKLFINEGYDNYKRIKEGQA